MPSVYFADVGIERNLQMLNATLAETLRLAGAVQRTPQVYPFMWSYYNSGNMSTLLHPSEAAACVDWPMGFNSSGVIVWGDPVYFNRTHPGRLRQFAQFYNATLGPLVRALPRATTGRH